MSAEGLKTELSMHEDDSIAGFQEIFSGCCTSSACGELDVRTREVDVKRLFRTGTEVVKKSDTVSSERDPRSTGKIRTNDFLHWYN